MPFTVAANDRLEVKFYCKSEGQFSVNTVHYRVDTVAGTSVTDAAVATKMSQYFNGRIMDVLSDGASFMGVTAQIIKPTRRPKILDTTGAGTGQFSGDQLPRQVCGLIKKQTALADRHGRGRFYVPFPPETANQPNGVPSAAYLSLLDDLATLLDDTIIVGSGGNTADLKPVVYDRKLNIAVDITLCSPASYWATQRRRSDVRGGDRPPF